MSYVQGVKAVNNKFHWTFFLNTKNGSEDNISELKEDKARTGKMLKNSAGYKGPIPSISYSRYFSIESVKVTSDADGKNSQQEAERSLSKRFCARDTRKLRKDADKIEQKKVNRIELLNYQARSPPGRNIDWRRKTHLLPPSQKFHATTGTNSCHGEKLSTAGTRAGVKPPPKFTQELCSCRDIRLNFSSQIHERVGLKFDNKFHMKEQQRVPKEDIDKRSMSVKSSYHDIEEEMQREKIINLWMQFFG